MNDLNVLNTLSKKVSFHTLGCRLNFSETGSIANGFAERGYRVVGFDEPADVVFLNTCTVTDGADSTCRNLIRKAQRKSPEAKIVVAGCYAQMEADKIKKMQGVDLILGTSEKYKVFDYLDSEEETLVKIDKSNDFWGASTTQADSHTRAFLKVQDGCNYICSFCIIPFARGRSRAISIDEAISQANILVASGYKEIVLTGVNIGEYESTTGEKFSKLVQKVLEVKGLERLRLSSVEPNTITDDLLKVLADSEKTMDHFHIPLQSGDDEILRLMKRKYSVSDYKNVVEKIMKTFPKAAIGGDIIVGFPGETEAQFQNTYDLLTELPNTHFHVFPYSQRKNTVAAKMPDHIQTEVKKFRVKSLTDLGDKKLLQYSQNMVGETNSVLFERRNKDGYFEGYTTNYIRVCVKSDQDLSNQIIPVKLEKMTVNRLFGSLQL